MAPEKHACYPLTNFQEGKFTKVDNKPMFDMIPSRIERLLGRQQEMYDVLFRVANYRLVSILGPPGIGKTALSRNLAHFIQDRKRFEDGIIYISLRGCESSLMFLTRLFL